MEEEKRKDETELKERKSQIEVLTRQYEQRIVLLENTHVSLRNAEKEAVFRVQTMELDTLQKDDKMEKLRKDFKTIEDKCIEQEAILKTKTSELI